MRQKYETDLTDEQWDVIAPLFVHMRVFHRFSRCIALRARLSGLWDKILQHLVKLTRKRAGLSEEPTQALIVSQSVKTTGAVEQKRFDAEKKRVKRQIVTEDIGCLLYVLIHKANQHDTKMGYWVACLSTFAYPTLQKICGDGGYRCSFVYEA